MLQSCSERTNSRQPKQSEHSLPGTKPFIRGVLDGEGSAPSRMPSSASHSRNLSPLTASQPRQDADTPAWATLTSTRHPSQPRVGAKLLWPSPPVWLAGPRLHWGSCPPCLSRVPMAPAGVRRMRMTGVCCSGAASSPEHHRAVSVGLSAQKQQLSCPSPVHKQVGVSAAGSQSTSNARCHLHQNKNTTEGAPWTASLEERWGRGVGFSVTGTTVSRPTWSSGLLRPGCRYSPLRPLPSWGGVVHPEGQGQTQQPDCLGSVL